MPPLFPDQGILATSTPRAVGPVDFHQFVCPCSADTSPSHLRVCHIAYHGADLTQTHVQQKRTDVASLISGAEVEMFFTPIHCSGRTLWRVCRAILPPLGTVLSPTHIPRRPPTADRWQGPHKQSSYLSCQLPGPYAEPSRFNYLGQAAALMGRQRRRWPAGRIDLRLPS